jgi:hypothetical protein
MHALIFSHFTYNQQDDDVAGNVTKKIEKYASPRCIYPLGHWKCTPCMMFVAKGMVVTKLKTVNILNAVICFYFWNIFLFPAVERRDLEKRPFLFIHHISLNSTVIPPL